VNVRAVCAAVGESPLPVALMRLADRCILEVSPALAVMLGVARDELLEHDLSMSVDEPVDWPSLLELRTGPLGGYRRSAGVYRRADGTCLSVDLWVSSSIEPTRQYAVAIMLPADAIQHPLALDRANPVDPPLAVGTVDANWRIDRISADITPILGYDAKRLAGISMLPAVHPVDVLGLLAAVDGAVREGCSVSFRVRLRAVDGSWRLCRVNMSIQQGQPDDAALAFSLTGVNENPGERAGHSTPSAQLQAIGREFLSATTIPSIMQMPAAHVMPALTTLSTREMEIVGRLAAGDRVPLIARSLYLGASTVRNHLTAVYRKLGVNSQQELMTLLQHAGEDEN
jgi:DNA-binding CsgD family transcriptional regulator/PAS domain-containing protein